MKTEDGTPQPEDATCDTPDAGSSQQRGHEAMSWGDIRRMTLQTLASGIEHHLARIENDTSINQKSARTGRKPYYRAHAFAGWRSSYVRIQYNQTEKEWRITRDAACRYLWWLESGGVGKHFDAERAYATSQPPFDGTWNG